MAENKILVAYASKHGATAQIAERIGAVLRRHGRVVDVVSVDQVLDLSEYAAAVLGIAVYMGRWRKDAVKFLERNEQALSERPVWLFTSGPSGQGDPAELVQGRAVPPSQRNLLDRIHPREIKLFHGSLAPSDLGGFERWIIRRVKAQTGDFRDWSAIEAWASSIPLALAEAG